MADDSKIHYLPGARSGDGGGPEDPTLETRVERLEAAVADIKIKIDRIDGAIARLEPAIRDLAADNGEFRKSLNDLQIKTATRDELDEVRTNTSKLREDTAYIKGRLENIPSAWQMITYIMGSQVVLAGLLFTALKFGLK